MAEQSHELATRSGSRSPFSEILAAIGDEINAVERDPSRSFDVTHGRRLHRGIAGSLYTFRAELPAPLEPETPLILHTGGARHRGTLVLVDDFQVVVQLRDDIGEHIRTAVVATEPAFILDALRTRLLSLTSAGQGALPDAGLAALVAGEAEPRNGSDIGRAEAMGRELEQLRDPSLTPNVSQLRAMSRVAGSDLHFVWGPPGTGKTASLAQVARMLVRDEQRILVVAHANVAVDVAMVRVADALADTDLAAEGRVIRVGTPHHPDAMRRDEILLESVVGREAPELAREVRDLEARRHSLVASLQTGTEGDPDVLAAELRQVRDGLAAARAALKTRSDDVVRRASIVGATLSRLVLSDPLWEWRPDALLLDEASMVSFPWVLAAASRLGKRLVVFGDFRQLPPVYQARSDLAHRWMGRDVFDVSRVRERIDAGDDDPRVTLLETQYRMASPIGDSVSALAYSGRLTTHAIADERARTLSGALPWPNESLILIDTTALEPASQIEARAGSFSRLNILHFALGTTFAQGSELETALISPYRAQARLYAAAVRAFELGGATAATIHRFQGSERDAVIFDLVDAPPLDSPSRLTGGDVDLALRLTNVGLSRARAKAIVIVNLELVESRFAPASAIRRAVDLCRQNGIVVTPRSDEIAGISGDAWTWSASWAATLDFVEGSVTSAAESVVVNVPVGFDPSESVIGALLEADSRDVRTTVFGNLSIAQRLENSTIDLRLRPLPSFFALSDRAELIVGGRSTQAFASTSSAEIGAAVASMLLPELASTRTLDSGPAARGLSG